MSNSVTVSIVTKHHHEHMIVKTFIHQHSSISTTSYFEHLASHGTLNGVLLTYTLGPLNNKKWSVSSSSPNIFILVFYCDQKTPKMNVAGNVTCNAYITGILKCDGIFWLDFLEEGHIFWVYCSSCTFINGNLADLRISIISEKLRWIKGLKRI